MSGPYDDILGLPHHVSAAHAQMPRANRAAQFMPFAALTGYDAAIEETARRTDARITLGEEAVAALDMKLGILAGMAAQHPQVAITFFVPDGKKQGGEYVTATGAVKKIDDYARSIVLTDGGEIPIADVVDIESMLFWDLL